MDPTSPTSPRNHFGRRLLGGFNADAGSRALRALIVGYGQRGRTRLCRNVASGWQPRRLHGAAAVRGRGGVRPGTPLPSCFELARWLCGEVAVWPRGASAGSRGPRRACRECWGGAAGGGPCPTGGGLGRTGGGWLVQSTGMGGGGWPLGLGGLAGMGGAAAGELMSKPEFTPKPDSAVAAEISP